VDENNVRTMLNALAGADAPQPRFDMDGAMSRGRRGRRVRRARAGGTVAVAAGAVVAVVFALTTAAGPGQTPVQVPSGGGACASMTSSTPTASPLTTPDPVGTGSALAVPPVPLNPTTPCASFGWLPSGYSANTLASGNLAQAQPQYLELLASGGQGAGLGPLVQLFVNAADACTQTRAVVNCGWLGPIGDIALSHPAPALDGRPAYWAPDNGLLWQYAPRSWALVRDESEGSPPPQSPMPPASLRPVLKRIAGGVRFTGGSPLVFPYWLGGIPASWPTSLTQFAQATGQRVGASLWFGPAAAAQTVMVNVIPAADSGAVRNNIDVACPSGSGGPWGTGQTVTVDGARATVWTLNQLRNHDQRLCASDVDGYAIWADLQGHGTARFRSVTALVRALHLLSTDPARWTSSPLR
jgi:hypothetical protein